jgi:hypothetical protein
MIAKLLSQAKIRFAIWCCISLLLLIWAATHRPAKAAASIWGLWKCPTGYLYLSPNGLFDLKIGPDEFGGLYSVPSLGKLELKVAEAQSPYYQRWSFALNDQGLVMTGPDGQATSFKRENEAKAVAVGSPLIGVWSCPRGKSHHDILEFLDNGRYLLLKWPRNRQRSSNGRHAVYQIGTWNQEKGKLFLSPLGSANFEQLPFQGGEPGADSLQLNPGPNRREFKRVNNLAQQPL